MASHRPGSGSPKLKALVTGAAGFLGAGIVEALDRSGVACVAALRQLPPTPLFAGLDCDEVAADLTLIDDVSQLIATHQPDVVLHCASAFPATPDGDAATQSDRRMLDNLLATSQSGLLVVASTELTVPGYAETAFQRAYADSKRQLERRAFDHFQATGTAVQIVRYPHLAGATAHTFDRRRGRLLSRLISSALGQSDEPVVITVPPDRLVRFAHIQTAAQATVLLMDPQPTNRRFSVSQLDGLSSDVSLQNLVACIESVLGRAPQVRWDAGPITREDKRAVPVAVAEMIVDTARCLEETGDETPCKQLSMQQSGV